jgi:hypothetical protein
MNAFREFDRPWPIEDSPRATPKQINYIEILRNDLQLSIATRNAHIQNILKKEQIVGLPFDVWAMSRAEASTVIEKFKEMKETR